MISVTGLLLVVVVSIIIYKLFFRDHGKNFPKGPFALPILGNALQLRVNVAERMCNWYKKYGDIYLMYFGRDRCFVVNDLKLAKEIFNDHKFSARPDNALNQAFTKGRPAGILNSSGQTWVEQRRFTLRHLRDFGFGKSGGEEMIVEELKEFLDKLGKNVGHPMVINRTQQMAVLNTLWQIMAGVRYEHDDPRLWSVFNQTEKLSKSMARNPFVVFVPNLAVKFPKITGWNKIEKLVDDMSAIVNGHVDHHQKTFPGDGVHRDFIDSYITEINAAKDPQSSFYKDFGYQNLAVVIQDLFGAIRYSDFHSVLDHPVFGQAPGGSKETAGGNGSSCGEKSLSITFRSSIFFNFSRMPYAEAVIAETMRIATLVPTGLFHVATEDTKIREYDVPKGTWIIAPLDVFHNDEKIFPNSNQFKPERFISEDGKFHKHEAVVPFAFGKRACLGETLARDEVFLFVTHIFHRFTIVPAPANPVIDTTPNHGFSASPQDYECILSERL